MNRHRGFKIIFYLNLVFLILFSSIALASGDTEVSYGREYVRVNIAFGQPTNLRFSKNVISFPDTKEVKVDWVENIKGRRNVQVVPIFTSGMSKTVFTLSDGSLVKIQFVILKGKEAKKAEPLYVLRKKRSSFGNQRGPKIPELTLLKFMEKDHNIVGYRKRNLSKVIRKKKSGVKLILVRHYKGSRNSGYVLEVENSGRRKAIFNPSQFSLGKPNQLIYAASEKLAVNYNKGEAVKPRIFLISKKLGDFKKAQIPFEEVSVRKEKRK